MCGLFGAVGRADLPRHRVLEALKGRGPDDAGTWADDGVLLLHTRLAIQDLSPLGHQPMVSGSGDLALVFNGEIYNQHELRQELKAQGVTFHSRSDTEVLLEGFRRWGHRLWGRLNGIFAVACWEPQARRLTLARDGFGVKPLLWQRASWGCAFGSELSAFEAAGLASRQWLCPEGLERYALWGAVAAPHTLLAGVEVFPAGHWGQWQPGGDWHVEGFADPLPLNAEGGSTPRAYGPAPRDLTQALEGLELRLHQAVRRQAIGDLPVGLFLSGGLDSGLLAALLRLQHAGPIRSVSVGFRDLPGAVDESPLAARTAEHLGLEHHSLRIGQEELDASFDPFLAAIDQPSIDGFNGHLVSQAASDNGMRVAFSGLGADELFGGYGHMALRSRSRLLRVRQIHGHGLGWRARRRLRRERGLLLPAPEPGALDRASLPDASLLELRGYLADTLLRDGDAVTMHRGLELRVPFLDPDLAAYALALPEAWHRAEGPKGLLRRMATPLLPPEVLNAPKRGFNLALAPWLLERERFAPSRIVHLLRQQLGAQGLRAPAAAVWTSWALLRASGRWGPYWRWVVLAEWLAA
ncbi:MAG: asparagine synthase (glutamine-hydrolyzing) [Synechococcaceae cyanobacterium ELA445]